MPKYYAVEMDRFDGEHGTITPHNPWGKSFYCVGSVEGSVIKLVDYGYQTLTELEKAWPEVLNSK